VIRSGRCVFYRFISAISIPILPPAFCSPQLPGAVRCSVTIFTTCSTIPAVTEVITPAPPHHRCVSSGWVHSPAYRYRSGAPLPFHLAILPISAPFCSTRYHSPISFILGYRLPVSGTLRYRSWVPFVQCRYLPLGVLPPPAGGTPPLMHHCSRAVPYDAVPAVGLGGYHSAVHYHYRSVLPVQVFYLLPLPPAHYHRCLTTTVGITTTCHHSGDTRWVIPFLPVPFSIPLPFHGKDFTVTIC